MSESGNMHGSGTKQPHVPMVSPSPYGSPPLTGPEMSALNSSTTLNPTYHVMTTIYRCLPPINATESAALAATASVGERPGLVGASFKSAATSSQPTAIVKPVKPVKPSCNTTHGTPLSPSGSKDGNSSNSAAAKQDAAAPGAEGKTLPSQQSDNTTVLTITKCSSSHGGSGSGSGRIRSGNSHRPNKTRIYIRRKRSDNTTTLSPRQACESSLPDHQPSVTIKRNLRTPSPPPQVSIAPIREQQLTDGGNVSIAPDTLQRPASYSQAHLHHHLQPPPAHTAVHFEPPPPLPPLLYQQQPSVPPHPETVALKQQYQQFQQAHQQQQQHRHQVYVPIYEHSTPSAGGPELAGRGPFVSYQQIGSPLLPNNETALRLAQDAAYHLSLQRQHVHKISEQRKSVRDEYGKGSSGGGQATNASSLHLLSDIAVSQPRAPLGSEREAHQFGAFHHDRDTYNEMVLRQSRDLMRDNANNDLLSPRSPSPTASDASLPLAVCAEYHHHGACAQLAANGPISLANDDHHRHRHHVDVDEQAKRDHADMCLLRLGKQELQLLQLQQAVQGRSAALLASNIATPSGSRPVLSDGSAATYFAFSPAGTSRPTLLPSTGTLLKLSPRDQYRHGPSTRAPRMPTSPKCSVSSGKTSTIVRSRSPSSDEEIHISKQTQRLAYAHAKQVDVSPQKLDKDTQLSPSTLIRLAESVEKAVTSPRKSGGKQVGAPKKASPAKVSTKNSSTIRKVSRALNATSQKSTSKCRSSIGKTQAKVVSTQVSKARSKKAKEDASYHTITSVGRATKAQAKACGQAKRAAVLTTLVPHSSGPDESGPRKDRPSLPPPPPAPSAEMLEMWRARKCGQLSLDDMCTIRRFRCLWPDCRTKASFSKKELAEHLSSVHRKTIHFTCLLCRKSLISNVEYSRHLSEPHCLRCEPCGLSFRTLIACYEHRMWRHVAHSFACRVTKCQFMCDDLDEMSRHHAKCIQPKVRTPKTASKRQSNSLLVDAKQAEMQRRERQENLLLRNISRSLQGLRARDLTTFG